jgi:hypothetical protein
MKTFKSILQFQKHFNTDEKCRLFLEEQRWDGTPACPHWERRIMSNFKVMFNR